MSNNQKSITLTPSWKAFFWHYFLGLILIPALVGIYLIWKTRKTQKSISYTITDRKINVVDSHISQNIDLEDIRQAVAGDKTFGVGSVILKTSGREIELIGLKNPEAISQSIEIAVEAELKRLAAEKEAKPRDPEYEPGSMDRLEYLTGLWQQGLMTDEDFKAEKEKLQ